MAARLTQRKPAVVASSHDEPSRPARAPCHHTPSLPSRCQPRGASTSSFAARSAREPAPCARRGAAEPRNKQSHEGGARRQRSAPPRNRRAACEMLSAMTLRCVAPRSIVPGGSTRSGLRCASPATRPPLVSAARPLLCCRIAPPRRRVSVRCAASAADPAKNGAAAASEASPPAQAPVSSEVTPPAQAPVSETDLRSVIKFAAPALGIFAANPIMTLIDSAFVGSSAGAVGQAALSPCSVVLDFPMLIFSFLSTVRSLVTDIAAVACTR